MELTESGTDLPEAWAYLGYSYRGCTRSFHAAALCCINT